VTKKRIVQPDPSPFRELWHLAAGTVFLNHGSFGACPKQILELQAELREQMEAEPVQFLWRRYEERLDPARRVIARFVGVAPEDLVFVTNATTAINAVLRSTPLRPGDEVVTTDLDYNACRNVLVDAVQQARARLVVARVPVPLRSEAEAVGAVLAAVTRRTRLIFVDHVTSGSAVVMPIEKILDALDRSGIEVLVDGAHAPGMLPLNVAKLQPAFYTGNLHKWVCAPKGAAFLYAGKEQQMRLRPAVISHGNNTSRPGFSRFQDRFDWAGTADPTAWLCASAAIEYMGALLPGGWPELMKRNRELAVNGRRLLLSSLGVEPLCPESSLRSMANIALPERFQGRPPTGKIDAEQLRLYDEFKIEVPFSRMPGSGLCCVRISAQIYNTLDDTDI
jgi:isopenicillin-N epimerase